MDKRHYLLNNEDEFDRDIDTDNENDEQEYASQAKKSLNGLFNDNISDNDMEDEDTNSLLQQVDPELLQYFDEAHIVAKSSNPSKRKNAKIVYKIGDIVKYKRQMGTILFGPYDNNGKQMYEIQLKNGTVTSAVVQMIKR